jgi:hypothetical protein
VASWFFREGRLRKALPRLLPPRLVAFDKEIIELRRKAEWPAAGQQVLEPALFALWAQLTALRACGLGQDAVLRLAELCQECTANHVARRIAPEARNPEQMTAPERSLFHNTVIIMHGRVRGYDEAFSLGTAQGEAQPMGPLLAEFCRNLVGPAQAANFRSRTQPGLAHQVGLLLREAEEAVA